MSISTTKKVMVGAAAAVVVSLGTIGGFAAAEAVGGPTSTASTTTAPTKPAASNPTTPTAPTATDRAARRALFQKDFADELGVSVDRLKSAEKKVLTDRLDARLDRAVAAGNITQAKADAIREAVRTGDVSKLPPKAQERITKLLHRVGN